MLSDWLQNVAREATRAVVILLTSGLVVLLARRVVDLFDFIFWGLLKVKNCMLRIGDGCRAKQILQIVVMMGATTMLIL